MQNGLSIQASSGGKIGHFKLDPEKLNPDEQLLVFDQALVLTKTTEDNLERLLYPLFENRNVLLVGDAGIGKNALVYYINRLRNIPTIRFSFNQDTLPEDLVGSFRILPDGFHWQDGPLVQAMKHGYTFVADEMNLASPEILKRFISVLESRSLTLLEKDGSDLVAHERFRFIATQNPARGFEGRKVLPESISRLFTVVHLESYPMHEEVEIMRGLFPNAGKDLAEKVVSLQRQLEQAIWNSEIAKDDLEHYHLNIRTAQRFWQRLQNHKKLSDESSEFLHNIFAFYVDVFRLAKDREVALKTVAEVFQYSLGELKASYEAFAKQEPSVFKISSLNNFEKNERRTIDPLPLTRNRQRVLEQVKESLDANENLLLEGHDAVRMGELVVELANLEGRKLRWIFLAKGMHTSEIIGALRPVSEAGDSKVKWVDGPLVQALKNNEWIILDNIEAAGSELIEKLNMLLDHAASLALPPEAEGERVISRTGDARIIAIKRVRKSRNQSTISRAFRNRFFNLHVPLVEDKQELQESATILWQHFFGSDDAVPKNKESDLSERIVADGFELLDKMMLFHTMLEDAAVDKKIGQSLAEGIHFREENLLRWIAHIQKWLGENKDFTLRNVLKSGIDVHYLASLPSKKDQQWGEGLWSRIFQDLPLEEWEDNLKIRKKKLLKASSRNKKLYWDPAKHQRADLGRAKPKLGGRNLKKGLKINTPETGGQVKEGPDAWYGQDTQGNQGMGEPMGGGGAWGYRTDELFEAFLKKYKPKFDYSLGFRLQDYYEVFGKMLEDLEMDLENALESNMHIERRLASYGSRVEARKYLAYMAQKGSDRIFDHSRIIHTEDKLKGLEFAFFINKGRRLFNFHYSVASVVALQSAMEVLWDKKIPLRTFGYSDFDNMKKNIDLVEYTSNDTLLAPSESAKEEIFENMTNNWDGDTVEEYQMVQNIDTAFSPDATTKIAVIVSDFRGHRARAKIEDEINSHESGVLQELIKEYSSQNYVFLAMQTGTRQIAEHFFDHSVYINEENFEQAPLVLADEITKLILKYHRPAF